MSGCSETNMETGESGDQIREAKVEAAAAAGEGETRNDVETQVTPACISISLSSVAAVRKEAQVPLVPFKQHQHDAMYEGTLSSSSTSRPLFLKQSWPNAHSIITISQ